MMVSRGNTPIRETAVDLIGRPTSRESNLELIWFVRDYPADLGVESRLVHDETGRKANLYATMGPIDRAGLDPAIQEMLAGRTVLDRRVKPGGGMSAFCGHGLHFE